jgi:fatty-acyl-CoA synthase
VRVDIVRGARDYIRAVDLITGSPLTREVEEFLFRHPKVAEVQVIGVPDPRFVEEICAWIRLKPGESATPEEIREFCQGQIAHYKIPRHIRFVEEFPMTVTGKVQKYLMREAMIEELGLAEQKTA